VSDPFITGNFIVVQFHRKLACRCQLMVFNFSYRTFYIISLIYNLTDFIYAMKVPFEAVNMSLGLFMTKDTQSSNSVVSYVLILT